MVYHPPVWVEIVFFQKEPKVFFFVEHCCRVLPFLETRPNSSERLQCTILALSTSSPDHPVNCHTIPENTARRKLPSCSNIRQWSVLCRYVFVLLLNWWPPPWCPDMCGLKALHQLCLCTSLVASPQAMTAQVQWNWDIWDRLRPSETPCCSSNALLSSSTAESMWQFRASLDQIFPSRGGREMRTWSFNASPCQPLPQRTAGWLQFYRMHSKELCLRQHKSASIWPVGVTTHECGFFAPTIDL